MPSYPAMIQQYANDLETGANPAHPAKPFEWLREFFH